METRASYVVVGTFVIVMFAAAFGFVIWLTQTGFEQAPQRYLIYFEGSVTGLQVGSPVRFRGVPVGSVTDIRIDPENVERIRVAIEVNADTPVKTDTIATLGLQGITGVAYIQLTGGTRAAARLEPAPGSRIAVITSRPSGLEQVLERAPELLERTVRIAEQLGHMLDDKNLAAISATLENIRALTATVAERRGEIDAVLADSKESLAALRNAAKSVSEIAEEVKSRAGPIASGAHGAIGDLRKTLGDTRKMIADFSKVADRLDLIARENRVPLRDFSASGLYELTQFIAESRVLVASLTRLSAQIERNPARFFFGDTQKGFEAK